jgi:hypothetical protein
LSKLRGADCTVLTILPHHLPPAVGPAGPVLQHLPVLESVPVLVALQDIVPLQALLVPVETARKHLSQASHTLLQLHLQESTLGGLQQCQP